MELNDLIIFKTVVNEGSISKAAKELGYVQPNVTERIKKLEQELETKLQKSKDIIDYSKELLFVSHDTHCPFRNFTIEFLKNHNLSKKQLYQVDSYSLVKELVAQGKGIAFLPINNFKTEEIAVVHIENIPIYFFTNQSSEIIIPRELFD